VARIEQVNRSIFIRAYSYTYVSDGAGGLILLVPVDIWHDTHSGYKRRIYIADVNPNRNWI